MQVVAVHPDPTRLKELEKSIRAVHPDWKIVGFTDQMLAVKHGYNNAFDVLYTFTRMRPIDGFAVARLLREEIPDLVINFIGINEADKTDAMRFGTNSCTIEPVTEDSLRRAEEETW